MSVFAGFVTTGDEARHRAWLRAAREHIRAVGADGTADWTGPGVGLACANLFSGDDLHSPAPFSVDGAVWIAGDVRLDDRDTLRRAIEGTGRSVPRRGDDLRLLLDAYHAWGDDCLERIAGDFAFAIWDGRRRRMLCARDASGVIPLYIAQTKDGLLLSNALDPLRLHHDIDDALDERSVGDFLLVGFDLDPEATIFAAIRQLPPGESLAWQGGHRETRRFWRSPEWAGFLRYRRPEEYVEHFRTVLRDAVADRMRGDSIGLQVSGGVDSTSVAAMAAAVVRDGARGAKLRAYTISASSVMDDREAEYATSVTRHLDIPHEIVDVGAFTDVDLFDTRSPQPLPSIFRRTGVERELTRLPEARGRDVLTGIGGDVLLEYSPSFWLDWTLAGTPARAARALESHVRAFHSLPVPGVRSAIRERMARRAPGAPLPSWIDGAFATRLSLASRFTECQRRAANVTDCTGLYWPAWPAQFASAHPGATGHRIRFLHPFHDSRLMRFVLSVPPRPWLEDKRILRATTRGMLPDQVRFRPKTPLVRPTNEALHQQRGSHPQLLDILDGATELDRYLDRRELRTTIERGAPTDHRHRRALLLAQGFAHWFVVHRPRVAANAETDARIEVSERSTDVDRFVAAVP